MTTSLAAGTTGPAVGNSTSALIGNRLTILTFLDDDTVNVGLYRIDGPDMARERGVSLANAVSLMEVCAWPVIDKMPEWML